ncbi:MAG: DUF2283 domain-containing protein [Caldilineae bacterium]|nr:DUF2283 domain-containing protein [Chloroflexota bacterium]MCB9177625.1 DUF2283 domain-containing protein [Caldilineae bacterium]
MELTFDPDGDHLYIHLSEAGIARTLAVSREIVVDLDADGAPVGIELLRVSQWAGEDAHFHLRFELPGHGEIALDIPFPDAE